MKRLFLTLLATAILLPAEAAARRPHPRLMLNARTREQLHRNAADGPGKRLADKITRNADALLDEPLLGHELIGNRLLYTARKLQCRIYELGLAYLLTGKVAYADYAARQMLVAADFPDWNDQVSFLDAAEMTAAIAIGYDWCHDRLTPEQRDRLVESMVEKGLKRAFAREHGWLKTPGNWNTVCHASMLAGALAVAEREPELARHTLERLSQTWTKTIPAVYAPNGAYPEGPGYWQYGTDYLCFGLALLQSAFGSDFGLSKAAGFSATGDYITAVTGPSGLFFNYCDGAARMEPMFSVFFLADRFKRPDYLGGSASRAFQRYLDSPGKPRRQEGGAERMLPLALFFLPFSETEITDPPAGSYYSGKTAEVQVAILRDADNWLGVKGGTAGVSHGHMDGGSFVFDWSGKRWAAELGNDNYEKVEGAKRDLWNLKQESDRWQLFRTGPDSHSILRIAAGQQRVDGNGRFVKLAYGAAELDLSSLYAGSARQVNRQFQLLPGGGVSIADRLEGLRPGETVTWQLCTPARDVALHDNVPVLTQGDSHLRVESSLPARWEILPEEHFQAQYYAGKNGITMLYGHFTVPESGQLEFTVRLKPGNQ